MSHRQFPTLGETFKTVKVITECLNNISVKARMVVKLGHHDMEPVQETGQLQSN